MKFIPKGWTKWLAAGVVAMGLSLAVSSARAQDASSNYNEEGEPTSVPKLEMQRPMTSWGLAIVFLIGSLGLAFKSSKRTSADR